MVTVTDLFCGAGGSGLGASVVAGVELRMAVNHWARAVESHAANFPTVEHDCADVSQVDPRRYPGTDILWASPECTNHSVARGRRRECGQPDLFGDVLPDEAGERSRATMWDVPRFAEHHRYRAVIVENVVDAARWVMWPAWLQAMRLLGYRHRVVFLNSMHAPAIAAPRAPQSRDRMYVVFWRAGQPAPDLDVRPLAWCGECDREVAAVQSWKKPGQPWGRYRAQYLYRCPRVECRHSVVEPYADPAATAIDWSMPGQRIGDRAKPLSVKTLARIQAGRERYARPRAPLVPAGGTCNDDAQPIGWPMRAGATAENEGLLVPVEGRDGKTAAPASVPARTHTARSETALVVPYYRTGLAHPAAQPLPTVSTRDRFGVAFITELRGGGSHARDVRQPLATVTASGNHHMLVRHNTPRGDPAQMCTPVTESARTITTAGHQSLVGWPDEVPGVADCTFRMLEPAEIGAAMAFHAGYRVLGNRREQVRQYGNAVTPPAAEWLIRSVVASLAGDLAMGPECAAARQGAVEVTR